MDIFLCFGPVLGPAKGENTLPAGFSHKTHKKNVTFTFHKTPVRGSPVLPAPGPTPQLRRPYSRAPRSRLRSGDA